MLRKQFVNKVSKEKSVKTNPNQTAKCNMCDLCEHVLVSNNLGHSKVLRSSWYGHSSDEYLKGFTINHQFATIQ